MAATGTVHPRPATGGRVPRRAVGITASTAAAAMVISGIAAMPAAAANTAQNAIVSATPASFTPHVENGTVYAIVQVGSRIVVAGDFTSVHNQGSTTSIARRNIFAFNATTGQVDTAFNPGLDAAANSLDTDGTYVYVGGSFNTVAGQTARKVAKLTAAGSLVTNTAGKTVFPVPNGAVRDVVVRGSRLYIGGAFTAVGTTSRGMLAALDKDSGAFLPEVNVPFAGTYNGGATNIKRFDITPGRPKARRRGQLRHGRRTAA